MIQKMNILYVPLICFLAHAVLAEVEGNGKKNRRGETYLPSDERPVNILAEREDATIDDEVDSSSIAFPDDDNIIPMTLVQGPDGQTNLTKSKEYVSCPCKKILVSSLGEAASTQSQALGVYQYYQEFAGHPSYYGPTHLHASNRLYFSKQYQGYILGDKLGSNVGNLYVPTTINCPYMIPGGWQYYAERWFVDATLVVRCIPAST
jgi:hypothetical protein